MQILDFDEMQEAWAQAVDREMHAWWVAGMFEETDELDKMKVWIYIMNKRYGKDAE